MWGQYGVSAPTSLPLPSMTSRSGFSPLAPTSVAGTPIVAAGRYPPVYYYPPPGPLASSGPLAPSGSSSYYYPLAAPPLPPPAVPASAPPAASRFYLTPTPVEQVLSMRPDDHRILSFERSASNPNFIYVRFKDLAGRLLDAEVPMSWKGRYVLPDERISGRILGAPSLTLMHHHPPSAPSVSIATETASSYSSSIVTTTSPSTSVPVSGSFSMPAVPRAPLAFPSSLPSYSVSASTGAGFKPATETERLTASAAEIARARSMQLQYEETRRELDDVRRKLDVSEKSAVEKQTRMAQLAEHVGMLADQLRQRGATEDELKTFRQSVAEAGSRATEELRRATEDVRVLRGRLDALEKRLGECEPESKAKAAEAAECKARALSMSQEHELLRIERKRAEEQANKATSELAEQMDKMNRLISAVQEQLKVMDPMAQSQLITSATGMVESLRQNVTRLLSERKKADDDQKAVEARLVDCGNKMSALKAELDDRLARLRTDTETQRAFAENLLVEYKKKYDELAAHFQRVGMSEEEKKKVAEQAAATVQMHQAFAAAMREKASEVRGAETALKEALLTVTSGAGTGAGSGVGSGAGTRAGAETGIGDGSGPTSPATLATTATTAASPPTSAAAAASAPPLGGLPGTAPAPAPTVATSAGAVVTTTSSRTPPSPAEESKAPLSVATPPEVAASSSVGASPFAAPPLDAPDLDTSSSIPPPPPPPPPPEPPSLDSGSSEAPPPPPPPTPPAPTDPGTESKVPAAKKPPSKSAPSTISPGPPLPAGVKEAIASAKCEGADKGKATAGCVATAISPLPLSAYDKKVACEHYIRAPPGASMFEELATKRESLACTTQAGGGVGSTPTAASASASSSSSSATPSSMAAAFQAGLAKRRDQLRPEEKSDVNVEAALRGIFGQVYGEGTTQYQSAMDSYQPRQEGDDNWDSYQFDVSRSRWVTEEKALVPTAPVSCPTGTARVPAVGCLPLAAGRTAPTVSPATAKAIYEWANGSS